MTADLHPAISAAGLPARTDAVLRRERADFDSRVQALSGRPRAKREPRPQPLSPQALRNALAAAPPVPAAAWLAGRVDDRQFLPALAGLVRAVEPGDYGASTSAHVEASLSRALQGEPVEDARLALEPLTRPATAPQPLACYYLAQLGDPSGWPGLVSAATGVDGFTRLVAARYAIGFLPFAGQLVDGREIDPRQLLLERLADDDPNTADEIPALLAELAGDAVAADLRSAVESARHESTRRAARSALEAMA